nr:immunoglobulin heavy chain junction region [Macaca mulatta]
CARKGDSLDVW